jgi:hypothetical protein
MSGAFFNVSGIDPNDGAKIVFVWCRAEGQPNYTLAGSGHVVGAGAGLPPGIRVGQFSVTFQLPLGCSTDSVVVTDDKHGKEFLSGVTITHCSTSPQEDF